MRSWREQHSTPCIVGSHRSRRTRPIPRIAIVTSYGYLDTVSVLCDLAEMLAEMGYDVEIFTDRWPGFAPPSFASDHVVIRRLPTSPSHRLSPTPQSQLTDGAGRRKLRAFARVLLRRLPAGAASWIRAKSWFVRLRWERGVVETRLIATAIALWWSSRSSAYEWIIGVDPEGLRRAARLGSLVRARLAYYSLELMLADELTSDEERYLKRKEIGLSRRASFVIIQDSDRASLLSRDNRIPMDRFVMVPNAPRGPARDQLDRWWHAQFELPPRTRVLLHSGSVGQWTGLREIVDACAELPEPWILVVHTRYDPRSARHDPNGSAELDDIMRRAKPGKVYFSLRPVPRQVLPRLLDSADIGIAFYVPKDENFYTQKNIEVIGLSSGKVASYLAAGMPVIVNGASTLGALVQRGGFGIEVEAAEGIPSAVREIGAQYETMSRHAREFFERELDFRLGFARIADRMSRATSDERDQAANPSQGEERP